MTDDEYHGRRRQERDRWIDGNMRVASRDAARRPDEQTTKPRGQERAKAWEKCLEHGPAAAGVWACPTCLVDLRTENERLRAELAEWRTLRDPVSLHVNLLRGLPARLDAALYLHLGGHDQAKDAAVSKERNLLRGFFREALADKDVVWPAEVDMLYDRCFAEPYKPDESE
jgi:hypothetical protein